jgi:hypothetical protein
LSRIVSQLKDLDCYQGRVNGSWGRPVLAKLDLPVDEPQQATLDTLKEWKGPHCTIQAAVPRKGKASKYQAAKPLATYKKRSDAASSPSACFGPGCPATAEGPQ